MIDWKAFETSTLEVITRQIPGSRNTKVQAKVLDIIVTAMKAAKWSNYRYEAYSVASGFETVVRIRVRVGGRITSLSPQIPGKSYHAETLINSVICNHYPSDEVKVLISEVSKDYWGPFCGKIYEHVCQEIFRQIGGRIQQEIDAVDVKNVDSKSADERALLNRNRADDQRRTAALSRLSEELSRFDFSKEEIIHAWEEIQVKKVHES